MNLSQQQSQKISKAQPFADNSSKNLYYQNQNPSKSYANLRLNHTNTQQTSHTVGNNSFIISSKRQEARERKISESINGNEIKNLQVMYSSVSNQEQMSKSQTIHNRTHFWDYLLLNPSDETHSGVVHDQMILNSTLDLPNQLVIRQDTKRTRCGTFDSEMHVKLEHFLTFYCKQQEIKYKQGLNELAAPFLYLTTSSYNVTLSHSYNYFINFLDKFVPNFFQDSEFNSLQCFFFAFTLLMKYHDPNLNNFLQKNDISPEIYAYPWFITLFSSKVELDIAFNLWDLFLIENDQLLILYISLALMIRSKKLIMSVDPSVIPQTLSSLKIENLSDLKEIYAIALEIRKQTPISFSSRINQLNVLQKNYHKHQSTMLEMKQAAGQIQKYVAMPISPIELLHHLYPSVIQCPNPECEKNSFLDKIINGSLADQNPYQSSFQNQQYQSMFKTFHGDWHQDGKNITEDNGRIFQNNKQKECKYCSIKSLIPIELNSYVNKNNFLKEIIEISRQNSIKVYKDKQLDFKTFDLRVQSKNQGYLNKTTLVSMNKFDQETLDSLISDYIEYKNISHFSFIVSEYSTFDSDYHTNQSLLYVDPKQQEVYTIQKFSSDFIEYGFPYISIVEGGFKICHDIILYQGLKLNDHNADLCKYCIRSNQLAQPRKQPNSILDFFTNVFSSKDASQAVLPIQAGGTNNLHSMNSSNVQTLSNTNNIFINQKRNNSIEKYTIPTASFAINYSNNYQATSNNVISAKSSVMNASSKRESTQPTSDYKITTSNQNNPNLSNQISASSSFTQPIIKVGNQVNNKDSFQNRTSSLHNNSQQVEKSKIQAPRSSHKIKTKQDEDDQSEFEEFQKEQFSSASRNKLDKSSRINQVHASLSPPIKPKLMSKVEQYQYQLRTPTTKFLNNFQSQDSSNKQSASENKFKMSREQKIKASDINERSLTIPNEDSFCDENIDDINQNQIYNAQTVPVNSNKNILSEQQQAAPLKANNMNNNQNILGNNNNNPNPQILMESSRVLQKNIFSSNTIEKGSEVSNSKDNFSKQQSNSQQYSSQYQLSQSNQSHQNSSLSHFQNSLAESSIQDKKERKLYPQNSHASQPFSNQMIGNNSVNNQNKSQLQNDAIINVTGISLNSNANNNNIGSPQSIICLKEEFLKSQTVNSSDLLKKSQQPLNSNALKKIQNMGQVFQKQTKQNYFDMAKKQISQKNFQLRGLFQTYKVSKEAWNDFIQILQNKPFSFYECQNLKDKNSEEVRLFQNTPNSYKSSPRILILSQEFVLSISSNQQIIHQLQQIKNGAKVSNIIEKEVTSSKEDKNNFVQIKSFFFMRNLLRITSKKFNNNIISFYFKIPQIFKNQKFENTQYFQFIEKFDLSHLKEIIITKKYNEILHEIYQIIDESEKFEIKSLCNMENELQALDCIKKAKEYYTIQTSTNVYNNYMH
ncbi:hypothetical protein ABPG72_022680 [Tetrahymena utriculariae]